jgi:hypothetical protein
LNSAVCVEGTSLYLLAGVTKGNQFALSVTPSAGDGSDGIPTARRPLRYLLIAFMALRLWSEFDVARFEPISSHISNLAATGVLCLVLLSLPPIRRLSLPVRVLSVGIPVALVATALELLYERSPKSATRG